MDPHRLLEELDPESKEALRKKTEEKLGFSLSTDTARSTVTAREKKTKKVGRICTCVATAVCAVCLLIALPFILQNKKEPQPTHRYCAAADCVWQSLDGTIGDYNQKHGTHLLHLGLYDRAEEITTDVFVNKNDAADVIYFHELIIVKETYLETELYIMDNNTTVDTLELVEEACKSKVSASGVEVLWGQQIGTDFLEEAYAAMFEYQSYKYIIKFNYPVDSDRILQTVNDML